MATGMKPHLLNVLTALSLLLCIAAFSCLARSHYDRDNVWYGGGGRLWWLESAAGTLTLRRVEGWPARVGWQWTAAPAASSPVQLAHAGERPIILTPRDVRTSSVRFRRGTAHTTPDGPPRSEERRV